MALMPATLLRLLPSPCSTEPLPDMPGDPVTAPVSQAAALCCPPAAQSTIVVVAASHTMEHCDDHASVEDSTVNDGSGMSDEHDVSCLSACVQLGNMPLPMLQVIESVAFDSAVSTSQLATTPLPAHPFRLLRPPASLLI